MLNLSITTNTRPAGAGITSPEIVNSLPSSVKSFKIVYEVDSAFIIDDTIEVEYLLNNVHLSTRLNLQALKQYAAGVGMNEYCFDTSDHAGCHSQDAGTSDIDIYINENLEDVVADYLKSTRAGQFNVN